MKKRKKTKLKRIPKEKLRRSLNLMKIHLLNSQPIRTTIKFCKLFSMSSPSMKNELMKMKK